MSPLLSDPWDNTPQSSPKPVSEMSVVKGLFIEHFFSGTMEKLEGI